MDAFNRFSIEDFLSYFFPGVIGSLGITVLLLLTPLNTKLVNLTMNVTAGVVLVIWSYVFGIILAGFSSLILTWITKVYKGDPRKSVPFEDKVLEGEFIKAYKLTFGLNPEVEIEWSAAKFYLCRFLVESYVPNASLLIRRQISLKRLRENLMPTVLIWCLAGIFWAFKCFSENHKGWGTTLLVLSPFLSSLIFYVLARSWNGNRKREVRETCIALMVGANTGAFRKLDKTVEASSGQVLALRARRRAPALPKAEADLLQKINQGLPAEQWQRYEQLNDKLHEETITAEEHDEFLELVDRIELADAERVGHLIELANLRGVSFDSLVDQLGLRRRTYA